MCQFNFPQVSSATTVYCRCERQEPERLLGPEVTWRTSRRQRHDDVHSDRRHAAWRRQTHTSRRRRQFFEHVNEQVVVDRRRQRPRQGRVLGTPPLPSTLSRCQRHSYVTDPHSWYTPQSRTYLSACLAVNLYSRRRQSREYSASGCVCVCVSVCTRESKRLKLQSPNLPQG